MGLPYTWFTFLLYSVLPIIVTGVLSVKLTLHFKQGGKSEAPFGGRQTLNQKIMVQMLTIFALFTICTLPSRLVDIAMDMVEFQSHDLLLGFQFVAYVLYSLQGTLNPILYSMMAKKWRKKFYTLVKEIKYSVESY